MSKITEITFATGHSVRVLNPIEAIEAKITRLKTPANTTLTVPLLVVPTTPGEQKFIHVNPAFIVCMEEVDWEQYPFPATPPE